jgi:hypothetical protein
LCPELALVQGEFAYVQGELLYALVVCALCLSMVLLGCVELLPLPKGVRDLSSSSDLALCLSLAFDCLLEFLFIRYFFFFPLGLLFVCVVNALINGEIEDHVWFEDRWMVASWCDE